MDFERREYEYVRKIAETGSFLAAADKLYITQPSLSQFIRRIERHIGAELFDRSHQPVTLTEAGRIYLDIEGQIQELCKVREQRIQDLGQTIGGTVRIGSSNYRSSTILAKAIPVINERYPHIDICLEEGTTRELEDFALQGKTDFSIVVRTAGHSDLEYVELFQEELLLAISPAWDLEREPLYDKKRHSRYPVFDYHSLDGHPFLVMKEGQELRHSFFSLVEALDISPTVALETTDMATAQTLAGIGVGAAIVPGGLAVANTPAVKPKYFSLRAYLDDWDVVLAYKRGRYLSKADKAVISVICDVAG